MPKTSKLAPSEAFAAGHGSPDIRAMFDRCLCNETDGNRFCALHGGDTPVEETLSYRAAKLAAETDDAYSAQTYRSWSSVARLLLSRKFTEQEAEAIMRSKWTRWAADGYKGGRSSGVPASAVGIFLDKRGGMFKDGDDLRRQIDDLVRETFHGEPKLPDCGGDVRCQTHRGGSHNMTTKKECRLRMARGD